MNYVLEGGMNFHDELMKSICNTKKTENDLCLITAFPLEKDHITLFCNHSFNYSAILAEVIRQKKINYLEIQKLNKMQIKCPYCRKIQTGLLPFHKKFKKIKNVNWPPKYSYSTQRCQATIRSGKRKGESCNKYCFGIKCFIHNKETKICSGFLKSGKRKGQQCAYRAIFGDFCKIHKKKI